MQYAFKNFFGKTTKQAEELFEENALYYQEDLLSMPSIPFNYYVPPFTKYITSERARGDSDGASSFLHLIIELLASENSPADEKTMAILLTTAKTVAGKQDYYEADPDIYGDFSAFYTKILTLSEQKRKTL